MEPQRSPGENMCATRSTLNITILLLVSDKVVRSVMQDTLEGDGYLVVPTIDPDTGRRLRISRSSRSPIRLLNSLKKLKEY